MRLLVDTNVLIWWFLDAPQIPGPIERLIDDPRTIVCVSAASAWEICTKVRIGKLDAVRALSDDLEGFVRNWHFTPLPITIAHGQLAGRLPGPHRDPFDRMLAAQAILDGLKLVTNDPAFTHFADVETLW
ncbi:MAG: type II toxin-antitoxin system VapC family toxin [Hyphomicrobiaceae bacterium]|nr:type II toxin-antitoxin system VapC family toxin [Hyphomicrobiaceae bacterium]